MNDTRAALEEAAEKFWQEKHARAKGNIVPITSALADFYEQESSSLKLLLSAMIAEKAQFWDDHAGLAIWIFRRGDGETDRFPVEWDSSGIPVLTPEILEALKNAALS